MKYYELDSNDDTELTDEKLQRRNDAIQARAKIGLDIEETADISDSAFLDTENY